MIAELVDETDDGLEGYSCESLLDPLVFLRTRDGRVSHCTLECPVSEDPARRAEGIVLAEALRSVLDGLM